MNVDMENDSIKELLLKFSAPAISGMLISALYMLVDGVFIGKGVGPDGLGAINIAYPVILLGTSLSMMFGIGGSTAISVLKGQRSDPEETGKYLTHILLLTLVAYLVIVSVTFGFQEPIIYLLGSNKYLFDMVRDYLLTGTFFLIFYMTSITLNAVVRNDNSPKFAMASMALGAFVNITLDWLFILELGMGMRGAALATGIAQLASCLFLIGYFFTKRCGIRPTFTGFSFDHITRITRNGLPSFVMEFAFALVLILFNNVIMKHMGDLGTAAFGAICYIFYVFIMVFTGLAQGVQPIVSYHFGAQNYDKVKETLFQGHKASLLIGSLILLMVYFKGDAMIRIFNSDPDFVEVAANGLLIYTSGILFLGANFVNISYLQSREETRTANILSLLRSTLFVMLGLAVLPSILGINGIWLAYPFGDVMTFIAGIALTGRSRAHLNTPNQFNRVKSKSDGSISC